MKLRTIITQDAEVDDRNSLRHFLFYANEVELQGIIQTSSKFHWIGIPGAVKPEKKKNEFELMAGDGDSPFAEVSGPYSAPYRWPGTDWMFKVIDDYEKDYPKLCLHAEGYPTPDYLRSITKVGNIGYEGETEAPTEGSELIRRCILDDDPRPLYIQVWGGTNTICRALMDIKAEYGDSPEWPALHEKITKKVIITACGEQDPTYRSYLAEEYPGMQFVKTLQMMSYAYPWFMNPEGDSKDTLMGDFMKREILTGKSALTSLYCTWLDGNEYPGEDPENQFGANENIKNDWFGAKVGMPFDPKPFDFLSEGDSPTYFVLLDWGFRTLEDFSFGGIAGRYHKVEDQFNSKGEPLNVWDVSKDLYTGRDGKTVSLESMWPYVADIQRDFAARVAWTGTVSFEEGEHRPALTVREGLDFTAAPGEKITLTADTSVPDRGCAASVDFRIYEDGSAPSAKEAALTVSGNTASLTVPENALPGDLIHVILTASSDGPHRLKYYRQAVITVK